MREQHSAQRGGQSRETVRNRERMESPKVWYERSSLWLGLPEIDHGETSVFTELFPHKVIFPSSVFSSEQTRKASSSSGRASWGSSVSFEGAAQAQKLYGQPGRGGRGQALDPASLRQGEDRGLSHQHTQFSMITAK